MLMAGHQLVNLVRPRRFVLSPNDVHLIMNFVFSSASFRTASESWTPICLPDFNENGFLHMYVCFMSEEVVLVMISTKPEDFYKLSECKEKIHKEMTAPMGNTAAPTPLPATSVLDGITDALLNQHYSVAEIGIPCLLHFLYKAQSTNQFTTPRLDAPYNTPSERKRLFRLYQSIQVRVKPVSAKPHKVYYHVSQSETVVGWVTAGFELYATFSPLESKPVAIKACNQLLRWIKQEENNLFILTGSQW
eukprot:TRINITY_DN6266_c0_g1_i3.p1 TRINITY_DN6266_c0_g1~~TRINITY_DN6266_c0_g1_i3.p1  ORF type:complete len:248 (+),score=53.40 TRINITY_DN6266_c0_g1_i3:92-835(+)